MGLSNEKVIKCAKKLVGKRIFCEGASFEVTGVVECNRCSVILNIINNSKEHLLRLDKYTVVGLSWGWGVDESCRSGKTRHLYVA